jgi:hypothetical protein
VLSSTLLNRCIQRLPLQWVGVSSNRESVTSLKVPYESYFSR